MSTIKTDLIEEAEQALNFKIPKFENVTENGHNEKNTEEINKETKKEKEPVSNRVSKAWLSLENSFDTEEAEHKETKTEEGPPKKTVSKASASQSATTMVQGLDLMQTTLFYLVEILRYKSAFTKKYDWKRVKEILEENYESLSPEEKTLFDKVKKAQAKFKRRKDEIRMGTDELEQRRRAFFEYYQETGTSVSPGWGLVINVVTSLGQKGIDVAFDDGY